MATSDGRRKTVNDCYALKSTSCIPEELGRPGIPDLAAVLGRQPRHWDVPDNDDEGHMEDLNLPATDVPLSVMVAIEPGAKLWIYPDGCGSEQETALLVELEVGDVLVWRGDLVHAGAGYGVDHYRIHAYVDSPFFNREKGTGLCLRRPLFGAPMDASADSGPGRGTGAEPPIRPPAAKTKARGTAAAAVAQPLAVALRRRAAGPQSPASSGGAAASAHSSPSLHPDELSDGFNSDAEVPFNTANPLGLADDVDDEEDDNEAALAARNGDESELQVDAGNAGDEVLYAVDKLLAVRKVQSSRHSRALAAPGSQCQSPPQPTAAGAERSHGVPHQVGGNRRAWQSMERYLGARAYDSRGLSS